MTVLKLAVALGLFPMALLGQQDSTQRASGDARTRASVDARSRTEVRSEGAGSLSAESRAKLDVTLRSAREKNLPERPIQNRIAEGRVKGASETQIVLAARKIEARLEAAQRAMIRAGRTRPSADEVEGGAEAMERGTTEVQIEALARRCPSDRSLVVAFDVLTTLVARGEPVSRALASIETRLRSRASDASIAALAADANAQVGVALARSPSQLSGAGDASVTAATRGTITGTTSAGAGVAGTVRGVIRP